MYGKNHFISNTATESSTKPDPVGQVSALLDCTQYREGTGIKSTKYIQRYLADPLRPSSATIWWKNPREISLFCTSCKSNRLFLSLWNSLIIYRKTIRRNHHFTFYTAVCQHTFFAWCWSFSGQFTWMSDKFQNYGFLWPKFRDIKIQKVQWQKLFKRPLCAKEAYFEKVQSRHAWVWQKASFHASISCRLDGSQINGLEMPKNITAWMVKCLFMEHCIKLYNHCYTVLGTVDRWIHLV